MYRLENRLSKLERYREEAEEDTSIRVHITGEGDDQYPREPRMRVLHVELSGPAWWGEVGDDGVERWIGYA